MSCLGGKKDKRRKGKEKWNAIDCIFFPKEKSYHKFPILEKKFEKKSALKMHLEGSKTEKNDRIKGGE